MKSNVSLARPAVLAIVLASMLSGAALTGTAMAVQGNMDNAKSSLITALNYLKAATPDKGGHRGQAMQLVRAAIDQVNQGIQYASQHGG